MQSKHRELCNYQHSQGKRNTSVPPIKVPTPENNDSLQLTPEHDSTTITAIESELKTSKKKTNIIMKFFVAYSSIVALVAVMGVHSATRKVMDPTVSYLLVICFDKQLHRIGCKANPFFLVPGPLPVRKLPVPFRVLNLKLPAPDYTPANNYGYIKNYLLFSSTLEVYSIFGQVRIKGKF